MTLADMLDTRDTLKVAQAIHKTHIACMVIHNPKYMIAAIMSCDEFNEDWDKLPVKTRDAYTDMALAAITAIKEK